MLAYEQYIAFINLDAALCKQYHAMLIRIQCPPHIIQEFETIFKDELQLPLPFHITMDTFLDQVEVLEDIYSVPDERKDRFFGVIKSLKGEVLTQYRSLHDLRLEFQTKPDEYTWGDKIDDILYHWFPNSAQHRSLAFVAGLFVCGWIAGYILGILLAIIHDIFY